MVQQPLIKIRRATRADCDALGVITVAASFSWYRGHLPADRIDWQWQPQASARGWRRTLEHLDDSLFVVASQQQEIAGFAWAQVDNDSPGSELRALYVHPAHHQKGVGRALIGYVAAEFIGRGCSTMRVGCVRENPACEFYQHLGAVFTSDRAVQVDQVETRENIYLFKRLPLLAGA